MFNEEITSALAAPLARNRIKQRKQGSAQVSYLEAWDVMDALPQILGFGMWRSEERDIKCVHEAQNEKGGWDVSYIATVRLTVHTESRECCYDGTGSGHGRNQRYLGDGHESAVKEATTDAFKRAAIHLGHQFGLALYDKAQANVEGGNGARAKSKASNGNGNGNGHSKNKGPVSDAKMDRLSAMWERITELERRDVLDSTWRTVTTDAEADALMADLTAAMQAPAAESQPLGTVE